MIQKLFKHTLCFFAVLIFCTASTAQTTHWLNPLPAGNEFYDIAFFDGQHGLMCGQYGMICATSDGGSHWEIVFNEGSSSLSQINIVAPGHAFIKMGSRQLISTHDYGRVWAKVCQFPDSLSITKFRMFDEHYGYVLLVHNESKNTLIGNTINGGKGWNLSYTSELLTNESKISDFAFENAKKGLLLSQENQRLYLTSDSCATFEYVTFFPDEFYYKIINQNNGIYYALGRRDDDWHERIASNEKEVYIDFSYIILKSNDDGNSWQRVYDKNEMPDLNQMKTFGDSLVFVYGYCNYYWHPEGCIKFPMLVSRDQGISWSAAQEKPDLYGKGFTRPNIRSVGIVDHQKAFCCITSINYDLEGGRSSVFLENHNKSNLWTPASDSFIEKIIDLEFDDEQMILLTKDVVLNYYTQDRVWDSLLYPNINNLVFEDMDILQDKSCIIASTFFSDNLYCYYSEDGFNSYCEGIIKSYELFNMSVDILDNDRVYIFQPYEYEYGIIPKLFKFSPIDTSLAELELPSVSSSAMMDMESCDDHIYVFGGSAGNGGYYASTDEGESWDFTNLGVNKILKAFQINDSIFYITNGYTYGESGSPAVWPVNIRTGELMEQIFSAENLAVLDIVQTNAGEDYLLSGNYIYKRTDGTYWERFGPYPDFQSLKLDPDGQHVWAYGITGRMMYMGVEMPVGLEPEQKRSEGMALRSNPVGHALEIDLNLQYSGDALLSLYDLSGKTMMQHKLKLNGSPKGYNFNVGHLKPGMYILSLEYGGQRISEKVVKN